MHLCKLYREFISVLNGFIVRVFSADSVIVAKRSNARILLLNIFLTVPYLLKVARVVNLKLVFTD